MVLETKRLILRELEHGDFEALRRVLADSDIMRHYPYTFDDARVRGWIAKNIERYRTHGFGLWAVCLRSGGESGTKIRWKGGFSTKWGSILPAASCFCLRRISSFRKYAAPPP